MNKKLSRRLSACLDALSSLSRVADIGCDHAYLPCYAVANGIIESAIAIDVIDGPLTQAKRTIAAYGLMDSIELRKGSGLEPLEIGEVEGVVIAGMGGKLIGQLLEDSPDVAKSMKRLVFEPQGGEPYLRRILWKMGIEIIDEQILEEDGIIYIIMTAMPSKHYDYEVNGNTMLDELFGPILRQNVSNKLFIKKWHQKIAKIDKALISIPLESERRTEFKQKKQVIKDVLAGVVK